MCTLEAFKIVKNQWNNPGPTQDLSMKKRYEQQVGLHETFIESVPTALIITFLSVNSLGRKMLTVRYIHTNF